MRVKTLALNFRRARQALYALALSAALSGCAGSGGSPASPAPPIGGGPPSPSPPPPPDPPPGANPSTGGGHWSGWTGRDGRFVDYATCLVTETGEFSCGLSHPLNIDDPDSEVSLVGGLHGNLQISSTSSASGSGKIYATPGNVLTDGVSVVAEFTVTAGTLSRENRRLEFTFTSLGAATTFSGDFNAPTYLSPSASIPHGVYADLEVYGDPASLSIDQDGALFLQTASGCTGNGQVALNTPGYNAYTVDMTMSDCRDLNGTYDGLAMVSYSQAVDDIIDGLGISVFSEATMISVFARK